MNNEVEVPTGGLAMIVESQVYDLGDLMVSETLIPFHL
jgi:hypothetical protein